MISIVPSSIAVAYASVGACASPKRQSRAVRAMRVAYESPYQVAAVGCGGLREQAVRRRSSP